MQKVKNFRTVEHYLVPLGLALLNMCAVHLIWLLASQGFADLRAILAVSLALLLLTAGIITKRKLLLSISSLLYLTYLVSCF